ncbi:hypothetical protein ACEXQE_11965 [Herbiconiux sp. P17]|uniref:hypothetical protein n=1 Tax=Herbiconiux wuyangfengii TaxID=3342794 RepID=UPI0035B800A7
MRTDPPTGDDLTRLLVSMKEVVMAEAARNPDPRSQKGSPARRARRIVGGIVAAILLVGVGAAGGALALGLVPSPFPPAAVSTPTPAPTMTVAPSATPTPEPEPEAPEPAPAVPLDPTSSWTFGLGAFGPLMLAQNGAEQAAAFGWAPDSSGQDCFTLYDSITDPPEATDPRWEVSFGSFADDRGIQWIHLRAVGNLDVLAPDAPRTDRGIGLGSTEQELLAAYPEALITVDTITPDIGGYREFTVDGGNGEFLHFDSNGERLWWIKTDFAPGGGTPVSFACD